MKKRNDKKRTEHQIDTILADNICTVTRTIWLHDGIDDEALTLISKGFAILGPKPITIRMNSGGGDVNPGLAICDIIQKHGKVTVLVEGTAESMAAVILQAAKKRLITSSSHLMLHQGIDEPPTDHKKNIKAYLKLADKKDDICDELVLKRIQEKHRNYSWSKFRQETMLDIYLTAEESLKWGLVDSII